MLVHNETDSSGFEIFPEDVVKSELIKDMALSSLMLLILFDDAWATLSLPSNSEQTDAYFGRTALCWVVAWDRSDALTKLLMAYPQSNIYHKDKFGQTPMDYASEACAKILRNEEDKRRLKTEEAKPSSK